MARTKGGVTRKIINGKAYFYYQWYEDGKRRSRTISEQEANEYLSLSTPALNYGLGDEVSPGILLLTGKALESFISSVSGYKERFCMPRLMDYLEGPHIGKLFVLYGLRRTGKTTLMLQAAMKLHDYKRTAYITIGKGASLVGLNKTLRQLHEAGVAYVFIDEVTSIYDFIDGSSFLADVYARFMNIILSGTDSLGFYLASKNYLYDRLILEHTTYIPFKEFYHILDRDNIDEYIEYGGTFVHEGINYHESNRIEFGKYADSAIVSNIQHSLEYYQDGYNFMRLKGHYENDNLTNLINRVIQDQNHRFVRSVLTRRFKSRDYGSLKELIIKLPNHPELIEFIENVDEEKLYEDLVHALDISNGGVVYEQDDIEEMQRYLELLDVIEEIEFVNAETGATSRQYVFAQPGLRYSQCRELIESIFKQEAFQQLNAASANFLMQLLTSDVKGRMLEEIVLLDMKHRGKKPFRVSFAAGEYDMAIYDVDTNTSEIYEIKHSGELSPLQAKHIVDPELSTIFERRYGKIARRYVLYRGEDQCVGDVFYRNVESFLKM